jgi:hypothetical protein
MIDVLKLHSNAGYSKQLLSRITGLSSISEKSNELKTTAIGECPNLP